MVARWYVLRSKPRKEQVLVENLQGLGLKVFYPCASVEIETPGIVKWAPYFPGYLFVQINLEQVAVSTFQWMPHTIGLVCFGEKPGYVPDNLILALMRRMTNGNYSCIGNAGFDDPKSGEDKQDHFDTVCDAIMNKEMVGSKRALALLSVLEGLNN